MPGTLNSSSVAVVAKWDWSDAGPPELSSIDDFSWFIDLLSGSGAGYANKLIAKSYSIGAGATQSVDVHTSATDPGGTAVAMTKIRAIVVVHVSTSLSSQVTFGPAAVNPCATPFGVATDKVRVYRDSVFALTRTDVTGFAAVNGASDAFDIVNVDGVNAATVRVFIVGE